MFALFVTTVSTALVDTASVDAGLTAGDTSVEARAGSEFERPTFASIESLLVHRRWNDVAGVKSLLLRAADGGWALTTTERRLLAWAECSPLEVTDPPLEPVDQVLEVLTHAECHKPDLTELDATVGPATALGFGNEVQLQRAEALLEAGRPADARAARQMITAGDPGSWLSHRLEWLDYRLDPRPSNERSFATVRALKALGWRGFAADVAFEGWLRSCGTEREFLDLATVDAAQPSLPRTWAGGVVQAPQLDTTRGRLRTALLAAAMCGEKWPLSIDETLTEWALGVQPHHLTRSDAEAWLRLAKRLRRNGRDDRSADAFNRAAEIFDWTDAPRDAAEAWLESLGDDSNRLARAHNASRVARLTADAALRARTSEALALEFARLDSATEAEASFRDAIESYQRFEDREHRSGEARATLRLAELLATSRADDAGPLFTRTIDLLAHRQTPHEVEVLARIGLSRLARRTERSLEEAVASLNEGLRRCAPVSSSACRFDLMLEAARFQHERGRAERGDRTTPSDLARSALTACEGVSMEPRQQAALAENAAMLVDFGLGDLAIALLQKRPVGRDDRPTDSTPEAARLIVMATELERRGGAKARARVHLSWIDAAEHDLQRRRLGPAAESLKRAAVSHPNATQGRRLLVLVLLLGVHRDDALAIEWATRQLETRVPMAYHRPLLRLAMDAIRKGPSQTDALAQRLLEAGDLQALRALEAKTDLLLSEAEQAWRRALNQMAADATDGLLASLDSLSMKQRLATLQLELPVLDARGDERRRAGLERMRKGLCQSRRALITAEVHSPGKLSWTFASCSQTTVSATSDLAEVSRAALAWHRAMQSSNDLDDGAMAMNELYARLVPKRIRTAIGQTKNAGVVTWLHGPLEDLTLASLHDGQQFLAERLSFEILAPEVTRPRQEPKPLSPETTVLLGGHEDTSVGCEEHSCPYAPGRLSSVRPGEPALYTGHLERKGNLFVPTSFDGVTDTSFGAQRLAAGLVALLGCEGGSTAARLLRLGTAAVIAAVTRIDELAASHFAAALRTTGLADPARALQAAQKRMMQNTEYAHPRHWGVYAVFRGSW